MDDRRLRLRAQGGGMRAAQGGCTARRRELLAATFAATKGIDAVVTAGAPAEAPRIDEVPKWGNLQRPSFTNPFNVTG